MVNINPFYLEKKLREFLNEDLGHAGIDIKPSTEGITKVSANIISEQEGIICGSRFLLLALNILSEIYRVPAAQLIILREDGEKIKSGEVIIKMIVNSEILRCGIRTGLNLMAHLSGIATKTRNIVDDLIGLSVTILDTRKTTPGLRAFEKYAVRVGGAYNHRFSRSDGMVIKREDIKIDGGIKNAIDKALRNKSYLISIEIEVETLAELDEVIADGRVRHVMLDNMDIDTIKKAVAIAKGQFLLEASGVSDKNLKDIAKTGVNSISLGSLITEAKPFKFKMKIT